VWIGPKRFAVSAQGWNFAFLPVNRSPMPNYVCIVIYQLGNVMCIRDLLA